MGKKSSVPYRYYNRNNDNNEGSSEEDEYVPMCHSPIYPSPPSSVVSCHLPLVNPGQKCYFCPQLLFPTEQAVHNHNTMCHRDIVLKYSYPKKKCRGCQRIFKSFKFCGLMSHVQKCQGRKERKSDEVLTSASFEEIRPLPVSFPPERKSEEVQRSSTSFEEIRPLPVSFPPERKSNAAQNRNLSTPSPPPPNLSPPHPPVTSLNQYDNVVFLREQEEEEKAPATVCMSFLCKSKYPDAVLRHCSACEGNPEEEEITESGESEGDTKEEEENKKRDTFPIPPPTPTEDPLLQYGLLISSSGRHAAAKANVLNCKKLIKELKRKKRNRNSNNVPTKVVNSSNNPNSSNSSHDWNCSVSPQSDDNLSSKPRILLKFCKQ